MHRSCVYGLLSQYRSPVSMPGFVQICPKSSFGPKFSNCFLNRPTNADDLMNAVCEDEVSSVPTLGDILQRKLCIISGCPGVVGQKTDKKQTSFLQKTEKNKIF